MRKVMSQKIEISKINIRRKKQQGKKAWKYTQKKDMIRTKK